MSNRIAEWRRRRKVSQGELAKRVGTGRSQIVKLERGERRLTVDWLKRLATALDCQPADLMDDDDLHVETVPDLPEPETRHGLVYVPEYDVRAAAGDGFVIDEETQKGVWPFAQPYLRYVLGVASSQLAVVEVVGDSMSPTLESGDRVLVDVADKRPSPPGIFMLWDGDGTVVKRLERIPNSEPATLVIMSDNPHHGRYERLVEETAIVGRVVWFARRL